MLSSAIIYVALSYYYGQEGFYESDDFNIFDKIVCCILMFLWLIKFYVSQNKKQYLKRVQSIGELVVALPVIIIVKPDLFDSIYISIVMSRYIRIIVAANILTSTEKLSNNEVTGQMYKMLINLTMLILISALLFTGIENQTQLMEAKTHCLYGKSLKCAEKGYALLHPEKC